MLTGIIHTVDQVPWPDEDRRDSIKITKTFPVCFNVQTIYAQHFQKKKFIAQLGIGKEMNIQTVPDFNNYFSIIHNREECDLYVENIRFRKINFLKIKICKIKKLHRAIKFFILLYVNAKFSEELEGWCFQLNFLYNFMWLIKKKTFKYSI